MRNLQEVVVNGRNLRVELSTDEPYKPRDARGAPPLGPPGPGPGPGPGAAARLPGQQFPGGPAGPGGFTPPSMPGMQMGMNMPRPGGLPAPPVGGGGVNMNMLPPGQDVPMGQKATDVISKTLASIPPGKLEEVLTGMKVRSGSPSLP